MVNPGLHYPTQNADVTIGVQLEALRKEVGQHDVTFTADDTPKTLLVAKNFVHIIPGMSLGETTGHLLFLELIS